MDNERRKLEQERQELNTLINKGVEFEVDDVVFDTTTRFFGLFKKHTPRAIKRKFKIDEPTLATLDRLSAEWVEFAIDESKMQGKDGMLIARTMTHEHAIRCARIIAIAVLGENRLIPCPTKAKTQWVEDSARVEELTALFARTIKPSQLYQLYMLITTMANLGDFMNSIRLAQAERTTMPIRVEENNMA